MQTGARAGESLTNASRAPALLPTPRPATLADGGGHELWDVYVGEKPGRTGCMRACSQVSWTPHVKTVVKADSTLLAFPRWEATRHSWGKAHVSQKPLPGYP